MKGGAAGGGHSQVIPMEDINLHFTGDFHAIELAHNLLAALLDNHLHHGNALGIDPRRIVWKRVVDMNDRALRNIIVGLGGTNNSMPREAGFDITVASEVMACFCLSDSLPGIARAAGADHRRLHPRPQAGHRRRSEGPRRHDRALEGRHQAQPRADAGGQPGLHPRRPLRQHRPRLQQRPRHQARHAALRVHRHRGRLRRDLGAEKFFNIKCRKAGIRPDAVVIVATVRALKLHGGVPLKELHKPNVEALDKGVENLKKHIENIHRFGLPVVVAINHFSNDTDEEIQFIRDKCAYLSVKIVQADHWARGGEGAEELARAVVDVVENTKTDFSPPLSRHLHPLAEGGHHLPRDLRGHRRAGRQEAAGEVPRPARGGLRPPAVCMAKTQYSLSTDPGLVGRPKNFDVPLRDVMVSAGAGFVVVLTGDIMTMPGLPKKPGRRVDRHRRPGQIVGLF